MSIWKSRSNKIKQNRLSTFRFTFSGLFSKNRGHPNLLDRWQLSVGQLISASVLECIALTASKSKTEAYP